MTTNNISVTTGSIQGTQGGGEMYSSDPNNNANGALGNRSLEERAISHQRTLLQAGQLTHMMPPSEEADEEAQLMGPYTRHEFRRHNSNFNQPTCSI